MVTIETHWKPGMVTVPDRVYLIGKDSTSELSSELVYYEVIKRELKRRPICECRCDERLNATAEGSTLLAYSGLRGGLEHLKIKTRSID